MTVAICPTRHSPCATLRFLASLRACQPAPARVILVVDQRADTSAALARLDEPWLEVLHNDENLGYFGSVNRGLERVDADEPVYYLQVDLKFERDFHERALNYFEKTFPTGLGLMSFRDGIQDGVNASQGLTTRRWMWVVFGEEQFPAGYFRYHGDSEFTVRSQDLGRYRYCPAARAWHRHAPVESGTPRRPVADFELQNTRAGAWYAGEISNALRRLDSLAPPPPPALSVGEPTGPGVRLQFALNRAGGVWYPGKSGALYRGGNNDLERFAFVEAEDVGGLLATREWKLPAD